MEQYVRILETGQIRRVVASDPHGNGSAYCVQLTASDRQEHGSAVLNEWHTVRQLTSASRKEFIVDRLNEYVRQLQQQYHELPNTWIIGDPPNVAREHLAEKLMDAYERLQYAEYDATRDREVSYRGVERFSIPISYLDDYDCRVFTITYSVLADGTLKLPGDLLPEQYKALRAYFLYTIPMQLNRRGASLQVMDAEEQALFDAVIEAFKDKMQRLYERIRDLALSAYIRTVEDYTVFFSHFEECNSTDFSDVIKEPGQQVYLTRVSENYEGKWSWRARTYHARYFILYSPESDSLEIIQADSVIHDNHHRNDDEDF